jgi:hypothetical protein
LLHKNCNFMHEIVVLGIVFLFMKKALRIAERIQQHSIDKRAMWISFLEHDSAVLDETIELLVLFVCKTCQHYTCLRFVFANDNVLIIEDESFYNRGYISSQTNVQFFSRFESELFYLYRYFIHCLGYFWTNTFLPCGSNNLIGQSKYTKKKE